MHTAIEPADDSKTLIAATLQECKDIIESFDTEIVNALSFIDGSFDVIEVSEEGSAESQLITAKLYLDMKDWRRDATFLIDSIVVDIARALNGRREGVKARFLEDEDPCIEVQVFPQFCRDGRNVHQILKELERQIHLADSPLKHGFYTSRVKSIVVQRKTHGGEKRESFLIELDHAKKKVSSTLIKVKTFIALVRYQTLKVSLS